MRYKYILGILFLIFSCTENKTNSPIKLFGTEILLQELQYTVEEDSIATIGRLQSNDSYLLFGDSHPEKSFSLLNIHTGAYLCRFGTFGQGPGEILRGTEGCLLPDNTFFAYHFAGGNTLLYNIDSAANCNYVPIPLFRQQLEEARLNQIIPVNDSVLFGAGAYKGTWQYVLFNSSNQIIDYGVDLYNATDQRFNIHQKSMSNQGILQKHPQLNIFAYIVFNSGNMDIINIANDKIHLIKSLRLRNPAVTPTQSDQYISIDPDFHSPIGYIDMTADTEHIYALYTDKKWLKENGEGNSRCSDIVLVFDWDGNPIKKYKLNKEVYEITVNESLNKLYASCKNSEAGWTITAFDLGK